MRRGVRLTGIAATLAAGVLVVVGSLLLWTAQADPAHDEVALARLTDGSRVPPVDQPVWVVSLDPTSVVVPAFGPPGSPPYANAIYWLIFIDPESGTFL